MAKNTSAFMFSAFQKECLSRLIKGKEHTIHITSYKDDRDKEKPVWILDGVCGVVFWNDSEMFLSYPFSANHIGSFNNMLARIDSKGKEPVIVTFNGIKRDTGKDTLIQLSNDNGLDVYINEKYLKYFDLDIYTFYAYTPSDIVIVKYCGVIVGVIMPVRFTKG